MSIETENLWKNSTRENHVESMIELAYRLYTGDRGDCIKQAEAIELLQKAASLGSGKACFELFKIRYEKEINSKHSFDSTMQNLLTTSAKLGYEKAQILLATQYYLGQYIEKNLSKAKFWFRKIAEKNNMNAIDNLIRICINDDNNPEESKAEAHQWLKKKKDLVMVSAKTADKETQSEADAKFKLGLEHYCGQSGKTDYAKAMEYFLEASTLFHGEALYYIAQMHHKGEGVPQNDIEAKNWYKLAAEKGLTEAFYQVGEIIENGRVAIDEEDSLPYYIHAAKRGHAEAQYKVGEIFYSGRGVKTDYVEAKFYYSLAAKQNHTTAQENLIRMCFQGLGDIQSHEISLEWLKTTVQNDCEKADSKKIEEPFAEELFDNIF